MCHDLGKKEEWLLQIEIADLEYTSNYRQEGFGGSQTRNVASKRSTKPAEEATVGGGLVGAILTSEFLSVTVVVRFG